MKKYFLLLWLVFLPFLGTAQVDLPGNEMVYIELPEIPPSLSELSPMVTSIHFNLTEPDIFGKNEKREINMLGIVAQEQRLQQRKKEYETPLLYQKKNQGTFRFSNNVPLNSRGSNYDIYTGKLKNPVYEEMRARIYNSVYKSPYERGNLYSPFY